MQMSAMKTCFQIAEMQPFLCKDNKKVLITAQKSFFLRLLGCYKHFFGYFLLDKQAYIGKMSTSYEVDTPVRHSVGVFPIFSLKIL